MNERQDESKYESLKIAGPFVPAGIEISRDEQDGRIKGECGLRNRETTSGGPGFR